jgi:hypothetical protein
MAKLSITPEFLRSIRKTGKYQDYRDADLPGFALKVTPQGGIGYTYRWTKPDGTQGRKVIGHWPVMQPGDARESTRKEAAITDHKADTLKVRAERKRKKTAVLAVVGVPTIRAFLTENIACIWKRILRRQHARFKMIEHAFPLLLDKTLDANRRVRT